MNKQPSPGLGRSKQIERGWQAGDRMRHSAEASFLRQTTILYLIGCRLMCLFLKNKQLIGGTATRQSVLRDLKWLIEARYPNRNAAPVNVSGYDTLCKYLYRMPKYRQLYTYIFLCDVASYRE